MSLTSFETLCESIHPILRFKRQTRQTRLLVLNRQCPLPREAEEKTPPQTDSGCFDGVDFSAHFFGMVKEEEVVLCSLLKEVLSKSVLFEK